jgi:DNA invertase Pin-like site-specific DNA recombinase
MEEFQMENQIYGYIRVSSRDQNEDRQVIAMREFGIAEKNLVIDKQSGKDFARPGYRRLLRKLKPNDTLVIKSIDRLGRNYDEVLEQWRLLTKEKQVDIVVLDMPLLDTRKGRDLIGTLISDIVLQLLSYVAQTEREFIHQRQAEGIAAAKARGVKFGRKPKERPAEYEHLRDEWRAGRISARAAARQLGVAHRTFMKWVEQENPDC